MSAERGDEVEAWLKRRRDKFPKPDRYWAESDLQWSTLDDLLDAYREHADTGTPLSEEIEDGNE